MRFRISQQLAGHEVQFNSGNGWQACRKNGEPLVFKAAEEARSKINALRGMVALTE